MNLFFYHGRNRYEYYGAAEPPVRCGESHLSGLTEPPHLLSYITLIVLGLNHTLLLEKGLCSGQYFRYRFCMNRRRYDP